MKDKTTQAIIQHGIDGIQDMIENGERVDAADLHNRLYNEDYYIIGTYQAKQELEAYDGGTFAAIERVKDYEQSNFGGMTTEIDPEKIVNMLAYIIGEEALNESSTLQHEWDNGELSEDDLIAIKKELEEQL